MDCLKWPAPGSLHMLLSSYILTHDESLPCLSVLIDSVPMSLKGQYTSSVYRSNYSYYPFVLPVYIVAVYILLDVLACNLTRTLDNSTAFVPLASPYHLVPKIF